MKHVTSKLFVMMTLCACGPTSQLQMTSASDALSADSTSAKADPTPWVVTLGTTNTTPQPTPTNAASVVATPSSVTPTPATTPIASQTAASAVLGTAQNLTEIVTAGGPGVVLTDGTWVKVYTAPVTAHAGDHLLVRGLVTATTEDNIVTFDTRLNANGIAFGIGSHTTGCLPNNTTTTPKPDGGGNHHVPLYAIADYTPPTDGIVTIDFYVRVTVVSAKPNNTPPAGYVENSTSPIPGSGDSTPGGSLIVEHYATTNTGYYLSAVKHGLLGTTGSTPWPAPGLPNPVSFGPDALTVPVSVASGDLLHLSTHISSRWNSQVPHPNILDGEQIATVLKYLELAASPYIGEDVTVHNPALTVFNEGTYAPTSAATNVAVGVSTNFGNGAYIDNALTGIDAADFSPTAGKSLAGTLVQSAPSAITITSTPQQLWAFDGGSTLRRGSFLVNVNSTSTASNICRLTFTCGQETTTINRPFGNSYSDSAFRLDYSVDATNTAQATLTLSCDATATVTNGIADWLVYQ